LLFLFLNFFIANNDEIINPGILIKKYQISEKLFGFSVACYGLGSVVAGIFIYYNKILLISQLSNWTSSSR